MTLLDAKEYDPQKARKRNLRISWTIGIALIVFCLCWWFRYWPQERIVGHFFQTLQRQDYNAAYGIWMHDPDWQKHLDRKSMHDYPYADFYRDWGPGGEWGLVKTAKVYGASTCPGPGTGVVVDVIVNDRSEHAQVWVEKTDNTLSFPPCELIFH